MYLKLENRTEINISHFKNISFEDFCNEFSHLKNKQDCYDKLQNALNLHYGSAENINERKEDIKPIQKGKKKRKKNNSMDNNKMAG